MHPDTLKYVACPGATSEEPPCLGSLSVTSSALGVKRGTRPNHITEGLCVCEQCSAAFPVLSGILVLVPDLGNYLRGSYLHLKHIIENRTLVSESMLAWLRQQMLNSLEHKDENLMLPQPGSEPGAIVLGHKWTGAYLWAHYDRQLPPGEAPPVAGLMLDEVAKSNPHRLLEDMIDRHARDDAELAVDVGCSVGGFTARLASRARFALGLDLSVDKLLNARRALCHQPDPLTSYRFYLEGNRWVERSLAVQRLDNVDFVLASALRVPIASERCDIAASVNVVDIVDDPGMMLGEMRRIVTTGGLLLLASPYLDTNKAVTEHLAVRGDPPDEVRRVLGVDYDIVEEADDVPWVIRNARRRLQLFLDHCLAAVKR